MQAHDIVDFPHHSIFYNHKQVRLRPAAIICYPPGAGGQFIASCFTAQSTPNPGLHNEYVAKHSWGCPLDPTCYSHARWPSGDQLREHLNWLDLKAGGLYGNAESTAGQILISHRIPLLTSMVYDLHAREIIVIDVDKDSLWLVNALKIYKQDLHTDYRSHPWLISYIINEAVLIGFDQELVPHLEDMTADMLAKDFPEWLDLGRTPLAYIWTMRSLKFGKALDVSSFRRYMDMRSTIDNIYMWDDAYNTKVLQRLAHQADRITRVTYGDLFLRLELPEHSQLATLDRNSIRQYTIANLDHVMRLTQLLSDETAEVMRTRITACLKELPSS